MVGVLGRDATDRLPRNGRPVGRGEGEPVVRACVQGVHLKAEGEGEGTGSI